MHSCNENFYQNIPIFRLNHTSYIMLLKFLKNKNLFLIRERKFLILNHVPTHRSLFWNTFSSMYILLTNHKFIRFIFFFSLVHQNYVGADSEKVPFFLSVVLTDANSQGIQQYRAVLWKKTVRQ